jgi:hypothetical protein
VAPATPEVRTASKVFPRFMSALGHRDDAVLLDLGPVVGPNITFFGERLSCKIHVEDLFAEIEARTKKGERDSLATALPARLSHGAESFDGILCWDLFDFLDKAAGQALAAKLAALLKSGGVLYGLFGTTPVDLTHYTRFIVESDDALKLRSYPATLARRNVLTTRDINKMFEGLVVAESVLLKTSSRETLFRKP